MGKKREPEARLSVAINGWTLTGERRRGKWTFDCPRVPGFAERFDGNQTATEALSQFIAAAMANTPTGITEQFELE